MPDYRTLEDEFRQYLDLKHRPVAVAFRNEADVSIEKFNGSEPSGCSFWRLASAGRSFYTVPSDHYNCPIGCHTHNIPLPADRAKELPDVLNVMVNVGYLKMEEVPGIPVLPHPPQAIIYAPLGDTPVDPDVVLFAGLPSRIMLLEEAANRAGVNSTLQLLGRPTCMSIPAALAFGVVTSAGCIGNRIYTDIGDGELYACVPGHALEKVADALSTVVSANQILAQYHRERRHQLSTG